MFSQAVDAEYLRIYAEMAGIEFLLIDENTTIPELKKEILWNEVYYKFCK